MSSSSPDPDATGTLVVELPHWAATVRISDNLYRPVASRLLSKERSDPPRGLPLESTLAGGVYNVEVTLAGATDSEWVSVRPGRTTRIPAERWHKLQRLSSAPLADAGPEALQREPAEQWSRQRTWAAAPGGTARLFIFVRTDDPKRFPRFPEGLLLLNAAEEPVIGLTDGAQMDRQAGWMAFNADLSPGYYILCRKRSGVMVRHQPIFLCHGWETQIFIKARKNPSLRTLAMHMAPLGQGFRHDDEIAATADAILDALLHDQELRSVVGSSHLSTLLRGEHKNPWLGILGCYAITTFDEMQRSQKGTEGRGSLTSPDPTLQDDILRFLQGIVGEHPDVRALSLHEDRPAAEPFPHPPLLRAGLRRVRRNSMKFAATIPLGSLTERVLGQVVANSPWTAWRNLAQKAQAGFGNMAVGGSKQARATAAPMVAVPAFARRLPPSSPVFRIAEPRQPTAVATSVPRIADPADLHDQQLIKAAQRLAPGGSWDTFPTRITLNVPREVEEMLSAIDPYEVSTAAKMPLARVEKGLERLRTQHAAENTTEPRKPVSVSSLDQAVVQIALEEVALKADRTESAPPADAAADTGGKTPSAGRVLTIEETVARFRAEADRLSLAPQNDAAKRNEVTQRVQQLSSRLRQVSDGLLRHADFISITDVAGRVRYGNGAFTDLVSQAKRKGYETGWRAWEEAIASRPIGTSQLSSSIADARPRTWNLQRTLIEDETSGAATAYVNILRSAGEHKLAPDALKLIEPILNEVTLHASFVTYGSPERCVKSIEALEQLTAELETIIDGAPAVRKGKQSK